MFGRILFLEYTGSYKYAAALQAAQSPDRPPILVRIERKAGHGGGKPTAKIIEETADKMAFLIENLKVTGAFSID